MHKAFLGSPFLPKYIKKYVHLEILTHKNISISEIGPKIIFLDAQKRPKSARAPPSVNTWECHPRDHANYMYIIKQMEGRSRIDGS